jgi:hypothetical protein
MRPDIYTATGVSLRELAAAAEKYGVAVEQLGVSFGRLACATVRLSDAVPPETVWVMDQDGNLIAKMTAGDEPAPERPRRAIALGGVPEF